MAKAKPKKKETKLCVKCSKQLPLGNFYNSQSLLAVDGKIPICKSCLKAMTQNCTVDQLKAVLKQIDKPYVASVWLRATYNKGEPFGNYMRMINSLHQYDGMDGSVIIEDGGDVDLKLQQQEVKPEATTPKRKTKAQTEYLVDKWGFGYTTDEYNYFERKYELLKNNYTVKTAMHDEALKTYVRYRVKEEVATAKGDVKEAKEWGSLASKAAEQAKINPNQLSKNDLTDGLDNFGALARMVEQSIDIVAILPHLKERPQDKADFVLWNLVNYVRDLKGLPPCEYEDIYQFYEVRRKEYEGKALEFDDKSGDKQ
jgi:hypothetical protein